jgi:RimJ/RimL family protein N-acetyltransferase
MILETPRLILRKFKDSDIESFIAYHNDPEIIRYQSWDAFSEKEAIDFIQEQKTLQSFTAGGWFQIAIELKEDNQHIGDCAVNVKEDNQQAEIGFTISRTHQGQGYAFEAVSNLFDYLFINLNLHRVIGIADCENLPSIALLKKLGMRQEGHFIQSYYSDGKWSDEYLFAILRDEWEKLEKNK